MSGEFSPSVSSTLFASDNEWRAFERFRSALEPAGYVVAHNLYVSRPREEGVSVRELDLLLIHPAHGIIVVEIKGGALERRHDGSWFQNGHPLEPHRCPDRQVHETLRRLRDAVWSGKSGELLKWQPNVGCMICMPDSDVTPSNEYKLEGTVSFSSDQFIDRRILNDAAKLRSAVDDFSNKINSNSSRKAPEGFDWASPALQLLSPEFSFSTSLIGDLEVDRQRLIDDERIHADWVLVLAGAGSGKSVVARLRALSLAEQGKRVLLVCSTANLAASFQALVQTKYPELVLANTLTQALILLAQESSIAAELGVPRGVRPSIEAMSALRERIPDIAAATPRRFDAIILDEAQDAGRGVANALSSLLSTGDASIWTLGDRYQNLHSEASEYAASDDAPIIIMRQNHRNPRPIFDLAEGIRADGEVRFSRRHGAAPLQVDYRTFDGSAAGQEAALDALLVELGSQRIPESFLAVITLAETEGNPLYRQRKIGRYRLGNTHLDVAGARIKKPIDELPPQESNKILFDSAGRFKGMERGGVILVDVPDARTLTESARKRFYAAVTRATTYLAIVCTEENAQALKGLAKGA